MTSQPKILNSEKKATELPRWVIISWFIIFPLAFILTARFIYEQTYLTWARGFQMVGFSLAHQDIAFLILGIVALGLNHVWLLIVVALVIFSRPHRRPTAFQAVIIVVTVATLALNYIPYLWWQQLVVRIPGSQISKADIFQEAASEGRVGTAKGLLPSSGDLKTINKAFLKHVLKVRPK
jgi:hypothetical protein